MDTPHRFGDKAWKNKVYWLLRDPCTRGKNEQIRMLSSAANLDWPLQQFNVKNAFLHGDLE